MYIRMDASQPGAAWADVVDVERQGGLMSLGQDAPVDDATSCLGGASSCPLCGGRLECRLYSQGSRDGERKEGEGGKGNARR